MQIRQASKKNDLLKIPRGVSSKVSKRTKPQKSGNSSTISNVRNFFENFKETCNLKKNLQQAQIRRQPPTRVAHGQVPPPTTSNKRNSIENLQQAQNF